MLLTIDFIHTIDIFTSKIYEIQNPSLSFSIYFKDFLISIIILKDQINLKVLFHKTSTVLIFGIIKLQKK